MAVDGHNTLPVDSATAPKMVDVILSWVLDGYSDKQISRRCNLPICEVAATREMLRREGWA